MPWSYAGDLAFRLDSQQVPMTFHLGLKPHEHPYWATRATWHYDSTYPTCRYDICQEADLGPSSTQPVDSKMPVTLISTARGLWAWMEGCCSGSGESSGVSGL